jgi:hypothetical protein
VAVIELFCDPIGDLLRDFPGIKAGEAWHDRAQGWKNAASSSALRKSSRIASATVTALPEPEQDYWLRKAEELGWSTTRLRREVRASLAERRPEPLGVEPGPAHGPGRCLGEGRQLTVRVTLTPVQLALCEQAARSHGITFHQWAARALEQAAQASPPHHPLAAHRQSDA